jgi:hypothetical protein
MLNQASKAKMETQMNESFPVTIYVEHVKYSLGGMGVRIAHAVEDADGTSREVLSDLRNTLRLIAAELEYYHPKELGLDASDVDAFLDFLVISRRRLQAMAKAVASIDWFLEHMLWELGEEFRHLTPQVVLSVVDAPQSGGENDFEPEPWTPIVAA